MSGPKWTDEQRTAIYARDCNLLVSAAAGAGKTAVLVERIIRRVTESQQPVDVDRLLIVTFTKAAASEMRERIGAAILKELNENPHSAHLNRQITLLNRASITTLHSFCLEVVRQYFHRIDLDPAFRVADESEAMLLQLEAVEELFEQHYNKGNEAFLALVDAYGGERDDQRLQEMILSLYRFAMSNPWPQHWLDSLEQAYSCNPKQSIDNMPWAKDLKKWIKLQLRGGLAKLAAALKLSARPGGPAAYEQNLKEDMLVLEDLAVADTWNNLYQAFSEANFGKLKSCRDKDVDDVLKDKVKKLRDDVKKTVFQLAEEFFSREPAELLLDLGKVLPHVRTVTGLVAGFMEKYKSIKSSKGLVDFADLEHFCLQILMEKESEPGQIVLSPAAYELREHFEEVFVDEYQDINAVQETILNLVSRQDSHPNMFMVGDVKQSIYRFRLAEPSLFMGKYASYPREEGELCRAVDLTRNFRSRREVVDAVNFVFRQLMTPTVGEILYDQKAELVCGASYITGSLGDTPTGGPVELHLLEKTVEEPEEGYQDGDEDPAELDYLQREARLTAKRIRELVLGVSGPQLRVFDKALGDYRPVQFRDIVVLLRATKGTANIYMEEMKGAGIPVYADLDSGYFAASEVETMMAILKIIDNPRQDIPLAAVLRSPIVGLKAEELAVVRLSAGSQRGSFYEAVIKCITLQPNKDEAVLTKALQEKLAAFVDSLHLWRTWARQGSLSDLIQNLYKETGYYIYVGGMPGGAQRQANLRALYDRARQYEATAHRGLFRFLRFIEGFQDLGNDLGAARALGESEDVVRIMSIHKSKGLEFPVVIMAGLGKQFNTMDLHKNLLLHKELGIGLPVVEPELSITYPSLVQSAIRKKLHAELLAEEMRVLYVAMTRAREKLILIGSVKDLQKKAELWCANVLHRDWALPDAELASAKCFLDWLGPVIARHDKGAPIRKLACCEDKPAGFPVEDAADWQVFIWKPEDCSITWTEEKMNQEEILEKVKRLEAVDISAGLAAQVQENLNWEYPYRSLLGKAAKVAVTEVKRSFARLEEKEQEVVPETSFRLIRRESFRRPLFIREKQGLTPAERGSVMHLVMQHLDLRGDLTETNINAQVEGMLRADLLTVEQAEAVDRQAVSRFFQSEIGRRMLTADEIWRELPFTMALPASLIYPEIPEDSVAKVLVQGVLDCLLRERDELVILDYKTDRIPVLPETGHPDSAAVDRIVEGYAGQLKIYSMAVEKAIGRPVKEKVLYFFSAGLAINIS